VGSGVGAGTGSGVGAGELGTSVGATEGSVTVGLGEVGEVGEDGEGVDDVELSGVAPGDCTLVAEVSLEPESRAPACLVPGHGVPQTAEFGRLS
jgi:hypothetical protein